MARAMLTNYTRGGRSLFRIGKQYYVINTRHLTLKNAKSSLAYKDSFYFGKTKDKIVKYGRYYIVLQPVHIGESYLPLIKTVRTRR